MSFSEFSAKMKKFTLPLLNIDLKTPSDVIDLDLIFFIKQ